MRARRPWIVATLAVAALGLAAAGAAGPAAAACTYPSAYPGDSAAKATLAAWLAGGAHDAGLPPELPVMGSLVASDVRNLAIPDYDEMGYFMIRASIWNQGDYAGFPNHPSLQLQWFIDHAQAARQKRIAEGDAAYAKDSSRWGEWVADVLLPAAQYRDRYQPRLEPARTLVASGCIPDDGGGGGEPAPPPPGGGEPGDPGPPQPGTEPEPDLQFFPESVLPVLDLKLRKRQDGVRAGALLLSAACTNENCFIRTSGTVAVPGRGLFKLSAPLRKLKKAERASVKLALSRRARRQIGAARRAGGCSRGVVRVVAANAGGWRISASRTVALC